MKTKSNQSKIDCLQSNHLHLDYSELDHSQLNHSMMVNASSIVLGSLMGITLLSGLILSSSLTSADDAIDEITITVPTSCSMSSTGTNSHTAELGNGQSNSTIGETTITTYCNDNEGFAIYAIGYTGDTLGNTVLTDTSLGSTHDIATGTATSGNTSNWAMKLSTISSPAPNFPIIISGTTSDTLKEQGDPDYSSFQQVPDDYTKVAYRTSSTDVGTNAEGSVLKTTYQAYISPTQSAGTYQGKVKYVLVYPHNGDAPRQAFIMQNVSQWGSSITAGQEVTAIDSRDGKSYTVARLADGNLWMTQNLDHDIDPTYNYTNENTDIGYNTTTNTYDTASWAPLAATHATSDTEWGEYNEDTNPDGGDRYRAESYDPGDLYWNGIIMPGSEESCIANGGTWEDWSCNVDLTVNSGNTHYHIGNYYNWTAAIAMNNSTNYNDYGLLVEQSVCPAGWTLPRVGYGEDSFYTLWDEYDFSSISYIDTNENGEYDIGENALWTSPLYFTPAGVYGGYLDGIDQIGSSGFFHSAVSAGYYSFISYFDGYAYPSVDGDTVQPYWGLPIRCIARPVSSTIEL